MDHWQYRFTLHTSADVLAAVPEPVDEVPAVIFCSDEGACYFDAGPNPLTQAMERLLNEAGEEGWELVQILFRPDQMIGVWKRPRGQS